MASNATYVFMDLGTTNDPEDDDIKYITELSMAAVRKDDLIESGKVYGNGDDETVRRIGPRVPRVQLKLTLCFFNPGLAGLDALKNGGFDIEELRPEKTFDECFELINDFFNILAEPVYLIAHNGFKFDFPILKEHLKGKTFTKELLCADTYYSFYDILENKSSTPAYKKQDNNKDKEGLVPPIESTIVQFAEISLEDKHETKKQLDELRQANADRVQTSKGFPWGKKGNRPLKSYKLTDIYERTLKCKPEDSHKGDIDCQLMIRIAVLLSKKFVEWVENNHSSFEEHVVVKPTSVPKSFNRSQFESTMASNATYVFMDLGTIKDPKNENIKYITELSMAAVRKDNLIKYGEEYDDNHDDIDVESDNFCDNVVNMHMSPPRSPRVQLKLTLCFNPGVVELQNGGCNIAELQRQKTFDECFDLIDNFLNILMDPVYLIAHNGSSDILEGHLKGKKFSKQLSCKDYKYRKFEKQHKDQLKYDHEDSQKGDIKCQLMMKTAMVSNKQPSSKKRAKPTSEEKTIMEGSGVKGEAGTSESLKS